jgi:hypothetical protein
LTNPTSNYGFVLPTSTDLVTDLPADFEVALQGVDTRLKALQPGTTLGDIAYSSATANTNTRLGIGTTGQVLTVAAGVPSWATASSGSSNVAGKNSVLNSAMNVWQRGTTFAISNTSAYTADRWQGRVTAVCTTSFSRQVTGDTTNLPNIQYATRVQRTSGQTATPAMLLEQSFESVNSIPFAGKTVSLSFYARAGANYSAASNALTMYLYSGTGTDQNINGTYTGLATVITGTATLTTTWQRFTFTGTVASTATELALSTQYNTVGTAGAADYFDLTGVQLEIAASATAYSPCTSTYATELAACQRYYFEDAKTTISNGYATNTYNNFDRYFHPVAMRTTPTITQTGAVSFSSNTSATTFTIDANGSNTLATNMYFLTGASNGLTYLYRPVQFSAEL